MINKELNSIEPIDVQNLTANRTQDKTTIEFYEVLPNDSAESDARLLADVASFANTKGGDLIIGVKERNGVFEQNVGLKAIDFDAEVVRLRQLIREGIEPRVAADVKAIALSSTLTVIVLRTRASLETPHQVIFRGDNRFYARNSAGYYPMNVWEMRSSFLETAALDEKMRRFRTNRLADIKTGNTSLSLIPSQPFIALHIIPLSAFIDNKQISSTQIELLKSGLQEVDLAPFHSGWGWTKRINFDGVAAYSDENIDNVNLVRSYTQFYRNGIIEAVDKSMLQTRGDKSPQLHIHPIEAEVIDNVAADLKILEKLDFKPPFYIFLSLSNIKGFKLIKGDRFWAPSSATIDNNELLMPEVVVEGFDVNVEHKLRPIFDMVWNAAGISQSLNFDEAGNFIR